MTTIEVDIDGIDTTGTEDVSDRLNLALRAAVQDAGDGDTVQIPEGQYRMPYGLTFGCSGNARLHPKLGAYVPTDVVLDLSGVHLFTPAVDDERTKYGAAVLTLADGVRSPVRGGHLAGDNVHGLPAINHKRTEWLGVHMIGTTDQVLEGVTVEQTWSDFVYLNARNGVPCTRTTIEGLDADMSGRQGVTLNAADGLSLHDCAITRVRRVVFDHEPKVEHRGARDVSIDNCKTDAGGILFLNLKPLKATYLDRFAITNHRLYSGHYKVIAQCAGEQRQSFTLQGTTDEQSPWLGRDMVVIGGVAGWDHVRLTLIEKFTAVSEERAVQISPRCTDVLVDSGGYTIVRANTGGES